MSFPTSAAIVNRLAAYFVLTIGLSIISTFALLRNLGHDYITPWDEVVHVNVVHNLYADCCDPKLHTIDLGTGDKWTNSYIWLHKPMLPFYLRAALYHVFGESLFVFRLPSAFFAILTAASLFFIANRLSNAWVAVGCALLFASNQLVFRLVQGLLFSDLSDVMNVFFLAIVLGLALVSAAGHPLFVRKSESSVAYDLASLTAALFAALAYFCKGGFALPGLTVFAIALVWQCGRRSVRPIIMMSLLFGALVFAESFYFSHRFPHEFFLEQRRQVLHLFTDVEGWARPWDQYINLGWPDLLGVPLSVLGFLAMMASVLLSKLRNRRNLLLVLWILIYLVPLSIGVSKIPNFIVPVLPAVILLVGFSAYDLFHGDRPRLLYSLTGILFLTVEFYCWNILRFGYYVDSMADGSRQPFWLLAVSVAIVSLSLVFSIREKQTGLVLPSALRYTAVAMAAVMCVTVVIRHSYNNWYLSNILPENYREQMTLKATASTIKSQVPEGAVVLVDKANMINTHLYFQYWSGVNGLPAEESDFAIRTLSRTHPLYLLSEGEDPLADATLNGNAPHWSLSKIDCLNNVNGIVEIVFCPK